MKKHLSVQGVIATFAIMLIAASFVLAPTMQAQSLQGPGPILAPSVQGWSGTVQYQITKFTTTLPQVVVATQGDWLYAANSGTGGASTLLQINPNNGNVNNTVPLPGASTNLTPIVGGGGYVFIGDQLNSQLVVVQVNNANFPVSYVPLAGAPISITYNGTNVWVASASNVTAYNPSTGAQSNNWPVPQGLTIANIGIDNANPPNVWVLMASGNPKMYILNTTTNPPTARTKSVIGPYASGMTFDGYEQWVLLDGGINNDAIEPVAYPGKMQQYSGIGIAANLGACVILATGDAIWVGAAGTNSISAYAVSGLQVASWNLNATPNSVALTGNAVWFGSNAGTIYRITQVN